MASWDKLDGPMLYCLEPSGLNYGYHGCAIGKAKQAAKTEIEKLKLKEMTCKNLVKEAAKIIYQVIVIVALSTHFQFSCIVLPRSMTRSRTKHSNWNCRGLESSQTADMRYGT